VFREMWDTTAVSSAPFGPGFALRIERLSSAESHISQKTSEMWGTQDP
jgi:hypothetical protein